MKEILDNSRQNKTRLDGRVLFLVEHPGGIEPPVRELQSLALPLGYGCSERIIAPPPANLNTKLAFPPQE